MIATRSVLGWGNKIGYVFLPAKAILYKDPLNYIRDAKSTMDRKKNSLATYCIAFIAGYLIRLFGDKVDITIGVLKILCDMIIDGCYMLVYVCSHMLVYRAMLLLIIRSHFRMWWVRMKK